MRRNAHAQRPECEQREIRSVAMRTSLWMAGASLADQNYGRCTRSNASHAARCVACHGMRSHPVPVALVGDGRRRGASLLLTARRLDGIRALNGLPAKGFSCEGSGRIPTRNARNLGIEVEDHIGVSVSINI